MKRGITYEIPNEYGNFISDILEPLSSLKLFWSVGEQEIYKVEDNKLKNEPLFLNNVTIGSKTFWKSLKDSKYYVVFSDLKAYSTEKIVPIKTYADSQESNCQLVLLIADCTIVTVYCKEPQLLENLYKKATTMDYKNIEYITDENDERTCMEN
ncbi:DUF2691 family protein [Priestia aryabhattai]